MANEAFEILGLTAEADGRQVEQAYWRRAHELSLQRRNDPYDPAAAEELERINEAYQKLSAEVLPTRPPRPKVDRPSWPRRLVLAGAVTILAAGGLIAGLGYRDEIRDGVLDGSEKAEEGWNETIAWLQSMGEESTSEASDATSR